MQRLICYPACACVMAAIGTVVHYSSTSSAAGSPDDVAEWPGRKPVRKAAWMAAAGALPCGRRRPDSRHLCRPLEADAKGGSPQARSAALADLARLRTCTGRWRQHGSQHGQARQSSRLLRGASAHAYASGKMSSPGRTETQGVSVADQWQPGAPPVAQFRGLP